MKKSTITQRELDAVMGVVNSATMVVDHMVETRSCLHTDVAGMIVCTGLINAVKKLNAIGNQREHDIEISERRLVTSEQMGV